MLSRFTLLGFVKVDSRFGVSLELSKKMDLALTSLASAKSWVAIQ